MVVLKMQSVCSESRRSNAKIREYSFPEGTMGLKVEGACGFAEVTGCCCYRSLEGFAIDPRRKAGTTISSDASEIEWGS